jgi:hypothetical protein
MFPVDIPDGIVDVHRAKKRGFRDGWAEGKPGGNGIRRRWERTLFLAYELKISVSKK